MPNPSPGETEKDFLKRCIPDLIHEGYPQKQSVAVCYSIYRKEGTETKSPKPEKKGWDEKYGDYGWDRKYGTTTRGEPNRPEEPMGRKYGHHRYGYDKDGYHGRYGKYRWTNEQKARVYCFLCDY